MYCIYCGKKIHDRSRYCIFCGRTLPAEKNSGSRGQNGAGPHQPSSAIEQPCGPEVLFLSKP